MRLNKIKNTNNQRNQNKLFEQDLSLNRIQITDTVDTRKSSSINLAETFKSIKKFPLKLNNCDINEDISLSRKINSLSKKINNKPPTNDYLIKLTNLLKNKDDKYVEKRKILENSFSKNEKDKDVYLTMHNKISTAETKNTSIPLINETLVSVNTVEREDSNINMNKFKSFGIISANKNNDENKLGNIAGIPEFREDYLCLLEKNFPVEDKSFESKSETSRESENFIVNEKEKQILFKKIRNKEHKIIQKLKEKQNVDKSKKIRKDKVESFLDTSSRVRHIQMVTQKMRFINTFDKVLPPLPIKERNNKVLKQKDDNYLNKFKIFDEKRKKNLNELLEKICNYKSFEKNNYSFLKQGTMNTYTDENEEINFF